MDGNNRNVFWGLVIKPGKRYETTVQEPFRITKACIEPATVKDGKVTSVYVENDINEEFIIANLNLKNFNEGLDLSFNEGEKICFKVDGSGTVHLTGNLLDDPPPTEMFDMDDSEDDSEAMEDSEDEAIDAGDKIKEVSDKEAAKMLKRKKEQAQAENGKRKKAKVSENGDSTIDTTVGDLDDTNNFAEEEDSEDDDDDDESDDDSDEATTDATTDFADTTAADDDSDDDDDDDSDEESEEESKPEPKKTKQKEETPKKEKEGKSKDVKTPKQESKTPKSDKKFESGKTPKQEAKTPKQEAKTPKQEAKTPKQEGKTPKQETKTTKDDSKTPGKTPKRTIKGGIQVEDIKEGSGPECKAGSSVGMYYEGRLKTNNKKFDGLKAGDPFKFKLGKGEVIKGWDLGILGMKVGGKRRLTIPPKLAYGEAGAKPDIPPNSTLVFEIECKFVK